MELITDFKLIIDKKRVFKIMDCHENSPVYDEVNEAYESLKKIIEDRIKPNAIIKINKRPVNYNFKKVSCCSHIIYCILTLGKEISNKSTEFFLQGNYLEGMMIDAMADELMFQISLQLYKKVCLQAQNMGLGLTCRLSPGDEDFPMHYQKEIMSELNAHEALGLNISSGYMFDPVKSLAYIYGADKKLTIPSKDHDCSQCSNVNCKMRN